MSLATGTSVHFDNPTFLCCKDKVQDSSRSARQYKQKLFHLRYVRLFDVASSGMQLAIAGCKRVLRTRFAISKVEKYVPAAWKAVLAGAPSMRFDGDSDSTCSRKRPVPSPLLVPVLLMIQLFCVAMLHLSLLVLASSVVQSVIAGCNKVFGKERAHMVISTGVELVIAGSNKVLGKESTRTVICNVETHAPSAWHPVLAKIARTA